MRNVDIDEIVLPSGWLTRAQNATTSVENGKDPNDFGQIWRDLKDNLAVLLNDKCWYCESIIDRSDNAVDHFRPKNCVSDAAQTHNGYRWLAFDYKNYRYACTYCNSYHRGKAGMVGGGKADRFPLLNEANRCYAPGLVHQEEPALLDPCSLTDWELLGCQQENGKPCVASTDPTQCQRVELSIEIYNLHYEPTCKQRHRTSVQFLADIDQAKRLFPLTENNPDRGKDFVDIAKKIKRAISLKAPFSGELIFLLRGQRHSDHPWIQKLLET